jgi:nucleoside-diphosphate-sugar epimerase
LCRELLRQNKQVLGLVRSLSGSMEHGKGITYITVPDITEKCDRVFRDENIKTVVHLAAKVHVMPGKGAGDEEDYRRINTEGTLCLAAEAAMKNVKRFVFLSSIKVNGEYTEHVPFKESDPPAPQDAYAQSKFLAEEGLKKIAAETGMELVIIRPPMVYGPGAGGNFGKLLKKIRSGWYFPLAGVKNKRSLVFVGNLVDLICICLTGSKAAGNTFLVSDDHDVSTAELIEALAENSGRNKSKDF